VAERTGLKVRHSSGRHPFVWKCRALRRAYGGDMGWPSMPQTRSLDAVGLGMRVGGVRYLCRCPGHFELVWGWMGCGVNSNLLKVGAVAFKEIGTAFSTKPKVQPLILLPDFHEGIPPMPSRFVVASSCSHRQSPLLHDLPCRRRLLPSLFVFALSPISSLTSPTPDHLLPQIPLLYPSVVVTRCRIGGMALGGVV
jgi:hypothetical protein